MTDDVADMVAERDAEVERLKAALNALRPMIEDHRDELLRDFTVAGRGDRSTLDADEAEWIEEWDEALARVDAALGGGNQ